MNSKYSFLFRWTVLLFIMTGGLYACSKSDNAANNITTGTGGSLARFTIIGDYLYTVNRQALYTYELNSTGNPILVSSINIGWDIETIYPYKDKLFIGSMEAMYIYSLSNPASPLREGQASHVRSCDPVVAKDDYAYVTLRTNTSCEGSINALKVYDVSNLSFPAVVKEINLKHPYGLGVNESALYVCDDTDGLKIFDIDNPANPILTKTVTGYSFRDCIPHNDILICMVAEGMVIYDISEPLNPTFVVKLN